jgi:hypothetical protein
MKPVVYVWRLGFVDIGVFVYGIEKRCASEPSYTFGDGPAASAVLVKRTLLHTASNTSTSVYHEMLYTISTYAASLISTSTSRY